MELDAYERLNAPKNEVLTETEKAGAKPVFKFEHHYDLEDLYNIHGFDLETTGVAFWGNISTASCVISAYLIRNEMKGIAAILMLYDHIDHSEPNGYSVCDDIIHDQSPLFAEEMVKAYHEEEEHDWIAPYKAAGVFVLLHQLYKEFGESLRDVLGSAIPSADEAEEFMSTEQVVVHRATSGPWWSRSNMVEVA